jgi:hypothetical protein
MSEQSVGQESGQRYPNRWRPGQSGNPAGRLSVAAKRAQISATAHELASDIGGFESLGVIEQTLLMRAAEQLHRKPRDPIAVMRRDNLVSRILRDCLRRHQSNKATVTASSMRERLAAEQSA